VLGHQVVKRPMRERAIRAGEKRRELARDFRARRDVARDARQRVTLSIFDAGAQGGTNLDGGYRLSPPDLWSEVRIRRPIAIGYWPTDTSPWARRSLTAVTNGEVSLRLSVRTDSQPHRPLAISLWLLAYG
jgi:hypothetical protein